MYHSAAAVHSIMYQTRYQTEPCQPQTVPFGPPRGRCAAQMQVLALTDALVFLQIVALYMVVSRLTRLESQLRGIVGSGPAAPRAGAPLPTGVAKPTSPRAVAALAGAKRSGLPTAESLLPDAPKKDFRTADEWAPLTPAELAVAVRVRDWLGAERFSTVPNDLLVTFIRGYAYRADWAECTYVFLERALTWRAERKLDRVIARTMPNRHTFETVCPSGPVGFDDEGHMVSGLLTRVVSYFCACLHCSTQFERTSRVSRTSDTHLQS